MSVENWSENILVAALLDDPAFSDDVLALVDEVEKKSDVDVVLNFAAVSYLNSSNIAQLLKLRKKLLNSEARLRVCSVTDSVWSVLLITGLDKVFDFTDDVSTSLASLQIGL